jgi:hypothetical protein
MTMKTLVSTFTVTLALLASACSTSDGPAPQLAPAQKSSPAAAEEPVLEHSEMAASAPFVLSLVTPTSMPDQGEIEVVANIDTPKTINAPASIVVQLPAGATLVGGKAEETLVDLPEGVTTRTFRVQLERKLTGDAPMKVMVSVVDPNGAFGAHAVREYPQAPKPVPASKGKKKVPLPPVTRPGGPRRGN